MTETADQFIEVGEEEIAVTLSSVDSNKWVFVCHGFGGNRRRQSEYLELAEEGFNVVTVDFRGNGESDGEFIEQNLSSRIEDLKSVVHHFEPEVAVLFGTSFGGKVVFHAAGELNVDAVICKAPVTYNEIMDKFREVVEEKGKFEYIDGKPIDKSFFQDLDSYNFEENIAEIDCPVAMFHGSADTTVYPKYSFQAAEKIDSDIMLQKFSGEKHSFSEKGKSKLLTEMSDWLNRLF